jgi:NAD(P)-dependent dehydrogenase (short-subunit alcohol dehydrogenase family)
VLDVEERLWDAMMNVNLKGLFFLSKAVARLMKKTGGGSIINVASIDGIKPELLNCVYAVTKAGVIMVTKAMALELAQHNIRVNAIAPGNVHTKLGDSRFGEGAYGPEYHEHMLKRTPMGRIAEPEELGGTIVYLASDASSFVTGELIIVDGGLLLT